MNHATSAIKKIASETDRAVLFHSASGKDSIALLNLMHPHFKEIVCVYMYTVKDMEHIGRYISWATKKYPNVRFIQIPHYSVFSYIKVGFLGCDMNPKQRKYTLEQLTDIVRERTGIEWAFFGFKQSDSLNRRLMLRGYEDECINRKTKKCYPLSKYKNSDILRYIDDNYLIRPEHYGGEHQSAGCDVSDINYLLYLRRNSPQDLQRLLDTYPLAERILFEHDKENEKQ